MSLQLFRGKRHNDWVRSYPYHVVRTEGGMAEIDALCLVLRKLSEARKGSFVCEYTGSWTL